MEQTIGATLSRLRREKGMTQKQLAEILHVSDKAVSRWERGESSPELALIPKLADLYGVTCDELLRGEQAEPEQEPALPPSEKQNRDPSLVAVTSCTIAAAGLIVGVVLRCTISWRYFALCYGCVLLGCIGAGLYQLRGISAFLSAQRGSALRDRAARQSIRLCGVLLCLAVAAVPMVNSSLDHWEAAMVGAFVLGITLGLYAIITAFWITPKLMQRGFFARENREEVKELKQSTLLAGLFVYPVFAAFGAVYASVLGADGFLMAGMFLCPAAVGITLLVYQKKKELLLEELERD